MAIGCIPRQPDYVQVEVCAAVRLQPTHVALGTNRSWV